LDHPGLSEDLRRKLQAKLDAEEYSGSAESSSSGEGAGANSLPMGVVEELMSIADGHCDATWNTVERTFSLDPSGTLTRVGSGRTSDPALLQFSNLRLELAQDSDAQSFGTKDSVTEQRALRAAQIRAFLEQEEGAEPASVEKLVCGLRALQMQEMLAVPPAQVRSVVDALFVDLLRTEPEFVSALGSGSLAAEEEGEGGGALTAALVRALQAVA